MPDAAVINKDQQQSRDKATAKRQQTESKSARFSRIGTKRLKKAVAAIALLENLSSSNYEYTEQQVTVLLQKLYTAVQRVETSLTKPSNRKDESDGFTL